MTEQAEDRWVERARAFLAALIAAFVVMPSSPALAQDADIDAAAGLGLLPQGIIALEQATLTLDSEAFAVTRIFNMENPDQVVFVVLHDDEDTAFLAGVKAVRDFGGTLIALETDEQRRLSQLPNDSCASGGDPNRMFGCAEWPEYSAFFLGIAERYPLVVALHNNLDGVGNGQGTISFDREASFPSAKRCAARLNADPDNLILTGRIGRAFPCTDRLVQELTNQDINFASIGYRDRREQTRPCSYNCHMQRFMTSRHGIVYVNVEAEHGALDEQSRMVRALLRALFSSPADA